MNWWEIMKLSFVMSAPVILIAVIWIGIMFGMNRKADKDHEKQMDELYKRNGWKR